MTVLKLLPVDADIAGSELSDEIGSLLDLRDHYVREVQEAEALLARITARVQKRKTTLAKYEARLLELRIRAHMLGVL
jgi:hypothetical protein